MWNETGLGNIASSVGTPIMLDKQTLNKSRMNYARVCVEVDDNCDFPSSIPVYMDGELAFEVSVECPWKPPMCSFCQTFNHSALKCKKLSAQAQMEKEAQAAKTKPDKGEWVVKGSKRNMNYVENRQVEEGSVSHIEESIPSSMDEVEQYVNLPENRTEIPIEKRPAGRVIQTANMFEVLGEQDLNIMQNTSFSVKGFNTTDSNLSNVGGGGVRSHFHKAGGSDLAKKIFPSKGPDLKKYGRGKKQNLTQIHNV